MAENEAGEFTPYYRATAERPPRPTLLAALDRFGDKIGFAVDLGCGQGRDTVELLRRGWRVLGIDAEKEAIVGLLARPGLPLDRLETRIARFEDADWPPADLVVSSFALPLCPPERFPGLWRKIVASLRPGGRFAGQFYGDRDSWAGRPGMTFLDRGAVEALLSGLAVEMFEEEERDAVTPRGQPKHWHIWHVVARRD